MDIRKLQRAIVDGLEDVKAQNIAVFNTEHLSPLFERVIIASGSSNRQTKALASSVREAVKSRGMDVLRTEGEDNGEWIIVDCGAAVAHIMQPAIREYYHLEEIWGGKNVKLKLGDMKTGLVKAAESEPRRTPAKVAAKVPARLPGRPQAKAAVAKKASAPAAKKASAKAPVARSAPVQAAPPKKAVAKKLPAKQAAIQKVVVNKSATKKTAAKNTAAKNVATKKVAAKKVPARKPAPRAR